jgi:AcrR family transcriptional regulator
MASVRSAARPATPIHALIGSVPISGSLNSTPQPASTSPAPRWHRLDHDERRRQILACAKRLFSERNYASVSTSEIAKEAGVARGLLHHYFGTKRDLYLEVVRSMMRTPSNPVPLRSAGGNLETIIDEGVDRWLTMLERNRGTWLAAIGAQGVGRDPEVEAILDQARERAADRLIEALQTYEAAQAPPQLRALVRAYSGYAEAASLEWLQNKRLTRDQTRAALVQGFLSIVRDVLPAVEHQRSRHEQQDLRDRRRDDEVRQAGYEDRRLP